MHDLSVESWVLWKKENNGEVKRVNGENIKWANLNAHKKCENLLYELLSKIVIN